PGFVKLLRMEMESEYAQRLLGDEFIKRIRDGIKSETRGRSGYRQYTSKMGKRIIPGFMKSVVRDRFAKPEIDNNVLAFRVFTIVRMHKMLTAD
uniref:hypothetical protein n=1 Tax=Nocardia farcinica TaxID=37329 RepID=UPI001E3F99AA